MCPGWFDNLPQEDDAEDAISGVDSDNASKESTEDKTDANEEKTPHRARIPPRSLQCSPLSYQEA